MIGIHNGVKIKVKQNIIILPRIINIIIFDMKAQFFVELETIVERKLVRFDTIVMCALIYNSFYDFVFT